MTFVFLGSLIRCDGPVMEQSIKQEAEQPE